MVGDRVFLKVSLMKAERSLEIRKERKIESVLYRFFRDSGKNSTSYLSFSTASRARKCV